jgi:hypothetical protein
MEEREEKGRKKKRKKEKNIIVEKEGFPGAGPAFLAVQWVAAVRYN